MRFPAPIVIRLTGAALLLLGCAVGSGACLAAGPEKKARTDLHGDPLPPGALARLGTVRFRQGTWIKALAISPDGKMVASRGKDDVVYFWDLATGKLLRKWEQTADRDGVTSLTAPNHTPLEQLTFSPDGKLLAGDYHLRNQVRIWEVATGKEVRRLPGMYCRFTPDGKYLVTGGFDSPLRLWETASGKELRQLGNEKALVPEDFAPDGKTLVTLPVWIRARYKNAVYDNHVRLWDVTTGKETRTLELPEGLRWGTAFFSPRGVAVLTEDESGKVRLTELAAPQRSQTLASDGRGFGYAIRSPDRKSLVTLDEVGGVGALWDVATGKQLHRFRGERMLAAAFSPDGKTVVTGGKGEVIQFWDTATGKERVKGHGHLASIHSLVLSPDGKTAATAAADGTIRVWDAATGKQRLCFADQVNYSDRLALFPDGKTLAAARRGTIWLWDVGTGKEVRRLLQTAPHLHSIAVSPDGKLLAAVGERLPLRIWDTARGKEVRRFTATNEGESYRVAFSPDGKLLATGGDDEFLRLWETRTGQQVKQLRLEGRPESFHPLRLSLAFSPDGRTLAAGAVGRTIRFWEVATGKERLRISRVSGLASSVAFASNGRTLACGVDSSVRLWDTATGKGLCQLTGHQDFVVQVAFSADGKTLLSGSMDTTALFWDVAAITYRKPVKGAAPTPAQLELLWADLMSADAAKAYRAIGTLTATPGQTVPILKQRLRPVPAIDPKRLSRLLADLDSDQFAVRQKATKELEGLTDQAELALRQKLTKKVPLEARKRLEQLLAKLETPSGEQLRGLWAIEVLEHIATKEAKQVLSTLAEGASTSRLTQDARAAIRRLEGRP
jgi:WD40 repeat protein